MHKGLTQVPLFWSVGSAVSELPSLEGRQSVSLHGNEVVHDVTKPCGTDHVQPEARKLRHSINFDEISQVVVEPTAVEFQAAFHHHQIEASGACLRPTPNLEGLDPSVTAKVMHEAPGATAAKPEQEAPPCRQTSQHLSQPD